jgi:hypothetical protein
MILLALVLGLARADLAPRSDEGKEFVRHQLRVEGLDTVEGSVLVLHSKPEEGLISTHRVLSSKTVQIVELADGSAQSYLGQEIWSPQAQLMSQADFEAWDTIRRQRVSEQEEACMRGEGCAHISRFVPRFSPPSVGIRCAVDLPDIYAEAPFGSPTEVVHLVELSQTGPENCTLKTTILSPPPPTSQSTSPAKPWTLLAALVAIMFIGLRGLKQDSTDKS